MDIKFDMEDVEAFFEEGKAEVEKVETEVGEEAVEYARKFGNYRDVTGFLRNSNRYEVDESGLALINDAPYASDVEARGQEVLTGAALFAENRLKEEFE
ncbi:MAG: hypothetical protein IJS19_02920 [Muribaculaceae bacterium]|nr:hypothetical protein [Muribaculaceae bacterium]